MMFNLIKHYKLDLKQLLKDNYFKLKYKSQYLYPKSYFNIDCVGILF